MKLLSWNINGLRSMKKSMKTILSELDSDIVCFQETKISRDQILEDTAIIDGYSSFFSFPKKLNGYSGVATYSSVKATPKYAEDGISQFTVPDGNSEKFSEILGCSELLQDSDLQSLDGEGRAVITYHEIKFDGKEAMLSVINVYCPRVDPQKPERYLYKMQFCHLLEAKARFLLDFNYHVVILGDLNIAHRVIDHCDPGEEEEFNAKEPRQWLTSLVESSQEESLFVDAFRYLHPERKEAYSCWNTKTGARLTNFGTRIDYILVSRSLLPFLSSCEILSDIHGSDHCPVSAFLQCQPIPAKTFPSICTRCWPEFSGKQQNILTFVQKVSDTKNAVVKNYSYASKKNRNSQKAITNFFSSTQPKNSPTELPQLFPQISKTERSEINSFTTSENKCDLTSAEYSDYQKMSSPVNHLNESKVKQTLQWKMVLSGPKKPPLCKGHNKPCVLRTVRKDGPNNGRQFFSCPQPIGHSSNPESSCSFFEWVNPPKRSRLN